MKKKPKFNPDDADRSYILHEFLAIHEDFIRTVSHTDAARILHFLRDQEKSKLLVHHAFYNPHPETHDSVHDDLENTIISLESWINGNVKAEVAFDSLKNLRAWVVEQ